MYDLSDISRPTANMYRNFAPDGLPNNRIAHNEPFLLQETTEAVMILLSSGNLSSVEACQQEMHHMRAHNLRRLRVHLVRATTSGAQSLKEVDFEDLSKRRAHGHYNLHN
jgi:hypothetical protein